MARPLLYKTKRIVVESLYKKIALYLSLMGIGALILASCSGFTDSAGPVEMQLILPVPGQSCQFQIGTATIHTLSSLNQMRGRVGQVVFTPENVKSREEILDLGDGLEPADVQFTQDGYPLDLGSLTAATLYYAAEQGYLLYRQLDPSADLASIIPNLAETKIITEARRNFDELGQSDEATDNAEYFSHVINLAGQRVVNNYFFILPGKDVTELPMGINIGIMVHEYSHLAFHHLFYEPATQAGLKFANNRSVYTIGGVDEGFADIMGFLATGDPNFIRCTLSNSTSRNMSEPKQVDSALFQSLESNSKVSTHKIGAIFAAINYEIGLALSSGGTNGHVTNGTLLVRTMRNLPNCLGSGGTLDVNLADVANCHIQQAGSHSGTVRQIYSQRLGSYGGASGF